jgi:cytoskeletal protein CcmA (bactofilin family)
MPIKVRVGQSDAIKILASAGGGSIESVTSQNVIGGIASVSQLNVLGISTLSNVVSTGIITASSFVGPLTGDVTGTASTALTALNFSPLASLNISNLNVTGLSTFVGIVTTNNDLFVGGDFSVKGNIDLGRIQSSALNITGISTFVGDSEFKGNVSIAGTLTYEDVTNVDSIGIITARSGMIINTGGLIVSAGIATFGAIATFANNVFVDGTLTAGLIDGGAF